MGSLQAAPGLLHIAEALFCTQKQEKQMNRVMDSALAVGTSTIHPNAHFVDLENLIGKGKFSVHDVRKVKLLYKKMTHFNSEDVIVIASGPQNKEAIYEGWHNAVYQWRKGKDGADYALLDLFHSLREPNKFSHIYVASGDGALAPVAEESSMLGIPTTVVTCEGERSWKLQQFPWLRLGLEAK